MVVSIRLIVNKETTKSAQVCYSSKNCKRSLTIGKNLNQKSCSCKSYMFYDALRKI